MQFGHRSRNMSDRYEQSFDMSPTPLQRFDGQGKNKRSEAQSKTSSNC